VIISCEGSRGTGEETQPSYLASQKKKLFNFFQHQLKKNFQQKEREIEEQSLHRRGGGALKTKLIGKPGELRPNS